MNDIHDSIAHRYSQTHVRILQSEICLKPTFRQAGTVCDIIMPLTVPKPQGPQKRLIIAKENLKESATWSVLEQ